MELADGSLFDLLQTYEAEYGTPIAPDHLRELMAQAVVGIDFLNTKQHRIGGRLVALQHCDINPRNLLLLGDTVKLSDFSLTSIIDEALTAHRRAGTLDYAAPEIFQGRLSDRTDQYALGVTYCVLRGAALPFPDSPTRFDRNYVRPPPDLSMLPEAERPVIQRALAPKSMDRWHTCGEMFAQLEKVGLRSSMPLSRLPTPLPVAKESDESKNRKTDRYACNLSATWRVLGGQGGSQEQARVSDLSVTGLALVAGENLKQGVVLSMTLANGKGRLSQPFLVRVVRSDEQSKGSYLVGCRFVSQLTKDELLALL
jgi:serine/threonine protein kinase